MRQEKGQKAKRPKGQKTTGKRVKRIPRLKFDGKGLIPAVVQDYRNGEVLMVAYMNKESLKITLREKGHVFIHVQGKLYGERAKQAGISRR